MRAAGINFADPMARVGVYPDAPPPCVIGYDVAGEVESVGEGVEELAAGTASSPGPVSAARPSWSRPRRPGAAAAGRLSFEQGAAFPVNYATACAALVIMGGLREGDRALIHAAAGGVGIAAIQVARTPARRSRHRSPPSTTRSGRRVETTRSNRARIFETETMRHTGGEGVDLSLTPSAHRASAATAR